ncbi:MAG: hypothetical protein KIG84_01320 [Bacteroidales bacterium]|nr:hypothetical protein [Bacteroidales bacterium]
MMIIIKEMIFNHFTKPALPPSFSTDIAKPIPIGNATKLAPKNQPTIKHTQLITNFVSVVILSLLFYG